MVPHSRDGRSLDVGLAAAVIASVSRLYALPGGPFGSGPSSRGYVTSVREWYTNGRSPGRRIG